jgi:ADP-ribosylglycohydrolase
MTSVESRCTGSILGLAVGDALGYPAEFRRREQILREIGPDGITDFIEIQDPRFSRPFIVGERKAPGTYTDDTQMSLAVAAGLLEADLADLDELMPAIGRHFVAWSQADDNDRSPGATCMTGCDNLRAGMPWREAGVAQSKGCGSAMRVAPIGLVYKDLERVAEVARASSLLTHGHAAALEGAAACAVMVAMALDDATPEQMHKEVRMLCSGRSRDFDARWAEVPEAVKQPPEVALSERGLGESWVAEEAAASALYCVWRAPEDYSEAVLMAVNTDGDSDSIACIAGSVMGARLGLEAIPERWRRGVEKSEELHDIGRKLCARREQGVGP